MSRKGLFIVLAVIAFFAGQIFLEATMSARGIEGKTFAEFLVPVFELLVGGVLGFFMAKDEYKPELDLTRAHLEIVGCDYAELKAKYDTLVKESEKKDTVTPISKEAKKAKKNK